MFNKNNWLEPIYKQDLIAVIVNGLVSCILGGILAGVLDYLLSLINFPLSFGLIIIAYLVGLRVKRGYYSYHVLYPTLAIVFFLLGIFFQAYTSVCLYHAFFVKDYNFLKVFVSRELWIQIVSPFFLLIVGTFQPLVLFYAVIDLAALVLGIFITYRVAKGNMR